MKCSVNRCRHEGKHLAVLLVHRLGQPLPVTLPTNARLCDDCARNATIELFVNDRGWNKIAQANARNGKAMLLRDTLKLRFV